MEAENERNMKAGLKSIFLYSFFIVAVTEREEI